MIGFGSTSDYLGVGPALSIEVGGRHQLEGFSFAVALRARYERYSTLGVDSCTTVPLLAGPCAAPGASSYAFRLGETLVTFELPVTVRLGSPLATIFPYVGLAPGLVYDESELAAVSGPSYTRAVSGRLSMHGFVGTQIRLGPGGVFFEWGARVAPVERRADWDSHLTSFVGSLGYRLAL